MVSEKKVYDDVYEPREDSYLVKEVVESFAAGKVLDMGTGSGILAITAAGMDSVESVVAVDINSKAIDYAKKGAEELDDHEKKKLKFKKSDLFGKLKERFDTIIFNPPYLPDEKGHKDMALDGGKNGYELITRFLETVNDHLTQPGVVLLLFSSYSKKEKIDEAIVDNCLISEKVAEKKIGMETLYVYKIEKSTLLRELEMQGVEDVKRFARGKRGYVYKAKLRGEDVAIKAKNPRSEAEESIENEIKVLDFFNNENLDFIPEVMLTGHNYFVYRFIEGEDIGDVISKGRKSLISHVLKEVLKMCRCLDELGFNKEEMHRPHKHIKVQEDGSIKMLDFERCRETKTPKNVTQFCQYITSSSLLPELKTKGIIKDEKELRSSARDYKKSPSSDTFDSIIEKIM